jgi:hypothetical protein
LHLVSSLKASPYPFPYLHIMLGFLFKSFFSSSISLCAHNIWLLPQVLLSSSLRTCARTPTSEGNNSKQKAFGGSETKKMMPKMLQFVTLMPPTIGHSNIWVILQIMLCVTSCVYASCCVFVCHIMRFHVTSCVLCRIVNIHKMKHLVDSFMVTFPFYEHTCMCCDVKTWDVTWVVTSCFMLWHHNASFHIRNPWISIHFASRLYFNCFNTCICDLVILKTP